MNLIYPNRLIILFGSFLVGLSVAHAENLQASHFLYKGKVLKWAKSPVIEYLGHDHPKILYDILDDFNKEIKPLTGIEFLHRDTVYTDPSLRGNVVVITHSGISELKKNPAYYFSPYNSLYDFLEQGGKIFEGSCEFSRYTETLESSEITASFLLVDLRSSDQEIGSCFYQFLVATMGMLRFRMIDVENGAYFHAKDLEALNVLYDKRLPIGANLDEVKLFLQEFYVN